MSRLVTKLTIVPSAAVSTVCNTSPSDILAQIEQMVPAKAEMRISLSFISIPPFLHIAIARICIFIWLIYSFRRWLIFFHHRF